MEKILKVDLMKKDNLDNKSFINLFDQSLWLILMKTLEEVTTEKEVQEAYKNFVESR